jgi:hypothetical protein
VFNSEVAAALYNSSASIAAAFHCGRNSLIQQQRQFQFSRAVFISAVAVTVINSAVIDNRRGDS